MQRPSIRWELATQKNLQITNTSESNVNVLYTKHERSAINRCRNGKQAYQYVTELSLHSLHVVLHEFKDEEQGWKRRVLNDNIDQESKSNLNAAQVLWKEEEEEEEEENIRFDHRYFFAQCVSQERWPNLAITLRGKEYKKLIRGTAIKPRWAQAPITESHTR